MDFFNKRKVEVLEKKVEFLKNEVKKLDKNLNDLKKEIRLFKKLTKGIYVQEVHKSLNSVVALPRCSSTYEHYYSDVRKFKENEEIPMSSSKPAEPNGYGTKVARWFELNQIFFKKEY